MHITRFGEAEPYDAPRHFGMQALRLQGAGKGPLKGAACGFSIFAPNGGAERSASQLHRVYIVLSGAITISIEGEDHLLRPHDSCYIPAGEARALKNREAEPCEMLVFTIEEA